MLHIKLQNGLFWVPAVTCNGSNSIEEDLQISVFPGQTLNQGKIKKCYIRG